MSFYEICEWVTRIIWYRVTLSAIQKQNSNHPYSGDQAQEIVAEAQEMNVESKNISPNDHSNGYSPVPIYFYDSQPDNSHEKIVDEYRKPLTFNSLEEYSIEKFLDLTAHDCIDFPEIAVDNMNDYLDLLTQAGRIQEILDIYFKPNGTQPEYYFSSTMLSVTFALLDRSPIEFKDKQLRKLLHYYSLYFSISQLQLIRNRIEKFMPNCDPEHSPLLLTYLTGRLDKFEFYLKLGYDLNIPYITVNRKIFTPDGEDQVVTYYARFLFNKKTLLEIVKSEHPELLKKAIPA